MECLICYSNVRAIVERIARRIARLVANFVQLIDVCQLRFPDAHRALAQHGQYAVVFDIEHTRTKIL